MSAAPKRWISPEEYLAIERKADFRSEYYRGEKFEHYQQMPSLKECILVAQDRPFMLRFVRQGDGTWTLTEFKGLDSIFEYGTLAVRVPLREVYDGVEFPRTALS